MELNSWKNLNKMMYRIDYMEAKGDLPEESALIKIVDYEGKVFFVANGETENQVYMQTYDALDNFPIINEVVGKKKEEILDIQTKTKGLGLKWE